MRVKMFNQCKEDECFGSEGFLKNLEKRINDWIANKNINIIKVTQSQGAIGYSNGYGQYEKNELVISVWYE